MLSKQDQVIAMVKVSLENKGPFIRRWDEAVRLAFENPSVSAPLMWNSWTLFSKPIEDQTTLPRNSLTLLVGQLQCNAEQFMQGDSSADFKRTWEYLESSASVMYSWETSLETTVNYAEILAKSVFRLAESAMPEPAQHINPMPR
mmetsp:Transcript_32203/g.55652  ORF Transcript_32203/g.55652 Transcript_32203/m.55652 type:complete len:145 (+) Transcript_32203:1760-2194(+)